MEQKKTLWIIAAVGAFLLVVLGAACILYSPATKPYSTVASVSPVEKRPQAPQSGWTNPPVEPATPAPVYPQDANISIDTASVSIDTANVVTPEGTTIDLNALKRELYQETPSNAQPQNINITVNIPESTKETTTTYITSTPEYKEPVKPAEPVKVVQAPAAKPVEEKKVVKASVTTKSTPKPAAKAAPAPAPAKPTQFWVQVAAYSNKKGAEGARSVLDENKIPADIFTYKDNKENLFYRVRVGPYTTKSEAEYWRSKIVKIDEFAKAESFVTSTN